MTAEIIAEQVFLQAVAVSIGSWRPTCLKSQLFRYDYWDTYVNKTFWAACSFQIGSLKTTWQVRSTYSLIFMCLGILIGCLKSIFTPKLVAGSGMNWDINRWLSATNWQTAYKQFLPHVQYYIFLKQLDISDMKIPIRVICQLITKVSDARL